MTDIILGFVILALLVERYFNAKEMGKQLKDMTRALMAKNATELRDMEMVDKVKVNVTPQRPPDLIPLEQMDDEQFNEMIEKEIA